MGGKPAEYLIVITTLVAFSKGLLFGLTGGAAVLIADLTNQ